MLISLMVPLFVCSTGAQTMPAQAPQSPSATATRAGKQPVPRAVGATGSLPASAAAAQTQPIRAPRVWAIGEGFRVDPITGRAREEWRIDGNPLPKDFDYPHRNFTWDAKAGRIALAAARNEIVAYQLQIGGPARNVTVSHGDLKGPGDARIAARRDVTILKQWYLNVTQNSSNRDSTTAGYSLGRGWYADALVPATAGGGYGQPFDVPDRKNNIPGQNWQGIWIEIYVPRDTPAGEYAGAVKVAGEEVAATLPVTLEVYDVTLSDEFACEVGLNNYGSISPDGSIGRRGRDIRLKYNQLAHRHRMGIHEHYVAPATTGQGAEMRGVWDEYDQALARYFAGEAFTAKHGYRGPGEGKPVGWFYLPFEILGSHAWPMPKAAMHTNEYDAAVVAMIRDVARHFAEKGWTKTDLMFFVNGLDEPTKPEAVQDIRYFGDLVQKAGEKQVYYRGDINHLHDIDRLIPGWTEEKMLGVLAPAMDLWVCVADFKRTDFAVLLDVAKKRPHTVLWFYQNREPSVGGYTLDDETIGLRTWPVIAWKYRLDGCILWEVSFAGPSKDPWVDPNNSVSADGGTVHNLAGFLVYPPREDVTEPVASIRLKSFARGAQDYEYLRLLEAAAGRDAAERILQPVLRRALHRPGREYGAPGDWSHNPEDWERMRIAVLEAIIKARPQTAQPAWPAGTP